VVTLDPYPTISRVFIYFENGTKSLIKIKVAYEHKNKFLRNFKTAELFGSEFAICGRHFCHK